MQRAVRLLCRELSGCYAETSCYVESSQVVMHKEVGFRALCRITLLPVTHVLVDVNC